MNLSKSVVYMADDDADDRYFMCHALRTSDPSVTIVEAEDGQSLLTLLQNRMQTSDSPPVNLILLDMNMPRSNGLDTLIALKANPALRHIPTVLISTSAQPDQVISAYQNGINSYIQKPASSFDMTSVAQALKVCFLDVAMS
ncbi:MAG: response regulator [Spirosoma sp.]|nr:response regulator [Spirosoma sp.]